MKLGVSAFAWTSIFTERHLPLISKVRDYGFSALEIAMFDPDDLPVRALQREYKAAGLECTVCGILPPGINPISPDSAIRKKAQAHLSRCIEVAAELGCHLLGGPLYAPIGYMPPHRPTPDEWKWAVEAFQSLGGLLDAHDVTLSLEPVNRHESFFLKTASAALDLCEAIRDPRIGVTIDTLHANIEEKNLLEALVALGDKLKHLHASENNRGLLGAGHVNFGAMVRALKTLGYTGYLMIEGFGDRADSPGFLLADQGVNPDEIATKTLLNLKHLLNLGA